MTPNAESNAIPPLMPTASTFSGDTPLRWMKFLLARNPFFMISAALLLYSMRRLSLDSRILPGEVSQLLFNFSSFQVYELLLAITAIFLARRKIWYDSGLLVGLENLFVFVPFILVSQALMLEGHIAFAFCFTGCALIALRVVLLKKFIPTLNLPPRLLCFGAILLTINLGLPVLTRLLHKNSNMNIWDSRGAMLNGIEWLLLAPLLTALFYFIPTVKPKSQRESLPPVFFAKGSFPLFAFALWLAGTAAHLYCMGYVYGFAWKLSLVVPSLWLGAWILWKRQEDLDFIPQHHLEMTGRVLLVLPAVVTLIAFVSRDWLLAFVASVVNALIYGILARGKHRVNAFHLCLISMALALFSMPENWLSSFHIGIPRRQLFGIGLFGYLSLLTLISRNPKFGILGAVVVPLFVCVLVPKIMQLGVHPVLQIGILFVVLHSLRWDDLKHAGAGFARNFAAVLWIANSLWWIGSHPLQGGWITFISAGLVILFYVTARMFGYSGPRVVFYSAIAIAALPPLFLGTQMLRGAPVGLLILLVSFGLFALGTLVAITKSRWHSEE